MKKKIIWYLFDSEYGCGKKAFEKWDKKDNYEYYNFGLSRCNSNHFINIDLSKKQETLDKLIAMNIPKPDIILVSSPCEAFSLADTPLQPYFIGDRLFELKSKEYFDKQSKDMKRPRIYEKKIESFELGKNCIETSFMIIDYYKPKIYVFENPAFGYYWKYIGQVLKRDLILNRVDYGAYWDKFIKPSIFGSNKTFNFKLMTAEDKRKPRLFSIGRPNRHRETSKEKMELWKKNNVYAIRSEIPESLLIELYNKCDYYLTYKPMELLDFGGIN